MNDIELLPTIDSILLDFGPGYLDCSGVVYYEKALYQLKPNVESTTLKYLKA